MILFSLWACVPANNGPGDGNPANQTREPLDDVSISRVNGNDLAFSVMVTAPEDLFASVTYSDGEANNETPPTFIAAGDTGEILVLGLLANTGHELQVKASSQDGDTLYESALLTEGTGGTPNAMPTPDSVVNNGSFDSQERICLNVMESLDREWFTCMDRQGRTRMVLDHPLGDTFTLAEPNMDRGWRGSSTGGVGIWDEAGRLLDTIRFEDLRGRTDYTHEKLDSHEVLELQDGPWEGAYAVLTTSTERVGGNRVKAHGILVVDPTSKEVLWDWSAHGQSGDNRPVDGLDYNRTGMALDFEDWTHANALLHGVDDGGDFFWMSLRHQDWIIKIRVDTGEIEWRFGRDGDFELVDDLNTETPRLMDNANYMFAQHAPELVRGSGNRFFVFDNGLNRLAEGGGLWQGNAYSRLMEYEIDETSMQAMVRFNYGSPDTNNSQHFYSSSHGELDQLPNGNLMFLRQGKNEGFVAEVTYPDGQMVWKARYDGIQEPYRVHWMPSPYEATWHLE